MEEYILNQPIHHLFLVSVTWEFLVCVFIARQQPVLLLPPLLFPLVLLYGCQEFNCFINYVKKRENMLVVHTARIWRLVQRMAFGFIVNSILLKDIPSFEYRNGLLFLVGQHVQDKKLSFSVYFLIGICHFIAYMLNMACNAHIMHGAKKNVQKYLTVSCTLCLVLAESLLAWHNEVPLPLSVWPGPMALHNFALSQLDKSICERILRKTESLITDLKNICNIAAGHLSGFLPSDQEYYMGKYHKGAMLILNNYIFPNPKDNRRGWHADSNNLHVTFEALGFKISPEGHNLTAEEMKQKVQDFVKDAGKSDCSSTILVVASHGKGDFILDSTNRYVHEDDLISLFNRDNAPDLIGKPKLIIFQKCRAKGKDDRQVTDEDHDVVPETGDRGPLQIHNPQTHPNQDMLIAHATTKGFYALRYPQEGSPFIKALCDVFKKYSGKEHVMDMMIQVNQVVTQTTAPDVQLPCSTCQLTKKWYIFPERMKR